MKRTPVTSSNISEIGHDPHENVLERKYKNGGIYRYAGVDADKHAAMMDPKKTPSIGAFVHANIKGVHPYTRADSE